MNEDLMIYKEEIEGLKAQHFIKECNEKEKLHRKKLYQVAKRFLVLMGFMEKAFKVLDNEKQL